MFESRSDRNPDRPEGGVELGQVLATPAALEALKEAGLSFVDLLARHVRQDWGELDAEDRRANDRALLEGTRLLSAYTLPTGQKIWIITEADRSATTFCFLANIEVYAEIRHQEGTGRSVRVIRANDLQESGHDRPKNASRARTRPCIKSGWSASRRCYRYRRLSMASAAR